MHNSKISKKQKLVFKLIGTLVSAVVMYILFINIDTTTFAQTLSESFSLKIFLSYASLSLVSLVARSYRFVLLYQSPNAQNLSTLLVAFATAIRNISMVGIPFRLGELTIPAALKFWGKPISASIHPLWISILYDIGALLCLASLYMLIFVVPDPSLRSTFTQILGTELLLPICAAISIAALALPQVTLFSIRYLLQFRWAEMSVNRFPIIKESINSIKNISFTLGLRVFLLSLILRVSKYTSLSLLFFQVHSHIPADTRAIMSSILCFVLAEGASSLPGSGFLSFGAYELSFVWLAKISNTLPEVNVSSLAITHILGFSFEIILMAVSASMCGLLLYIQGRQSFSDKSSE